MESFMRKLGITEEILKALKDEKFEKPTEIQEKSMPLVMAGKDVVAMSATGSGKTLAFGIKMLQHAEKGKGIQALILTPTRELAEQVAGAINKFAKYRQISIIAVYGGVSINPQIEQLPRAEIVVGTPGRILDHIGRRTIDLSKVKTLVLDEADRMLDMGFIDDVEKIIRHCPKDRQTLMFSATIPGDIAQLARKYMKNPARIEAESYVDPKKLAQVYYDVPENLKLSLLIHLLKHEHAGLAMVFCNTQNTTDFVARNLKHNKLKAMAIHGGFSQAKRSKAMEMFHSQDINVLVCTDVAARGLDIQGVSHIYNYDIPKEAKQYIHRIGRTARAGNEGKAINLLSEKDHDNFNRVIREHRDVLIKKEERPHVERVQITAAGIEERHSSGHYGHRGSNDFHGDQGSGRFGHQGFRGHNRSRGSFHSR
jgi:ATP-dependent RNA helicase DeaD